MTRQFTNNIIGLITKAEAIDLLPFGRRGLESLIKKGEIGFKKVNGRYYFLKSDIIRWAENLDHHTEYTSEERHTGRISHIQPYPEKKYSLDALAKQMTQEKLNNFALKKYRKSELVNKTSLPENCPA